MRFEGTACYGRFSDELQNADSAEDQVARQERLMKPGERLVGRYLDEAVTGTIKGRDGFQHLREDLRKGLIDIVRVESIDRLSRSQSTLHRFYEECQFHGVRILSESEGLVQPIHVALHGFMANDFVRMVADKTRRGLRAKAEKGRATGGKCFGYKSQKLEDGSAREVVDPDEAQIVRRIFREFADGRSPLQIAKGLNADGIPSPRRTKWQHTTIYGHRKRGLGILNNERYIGRVVWGRLTCRRHPESERRVSKLTNQDDRIIVDRPDMRIVDDDLWDQVKAQQKARSRKPGDNAGKRMTRGHRPARLLSGLVTCPECGKNMPHQGGGYYGCRQPKSNGQCTNSKLVPSAGLERLVLELLKSELFKPEHVQQFEADYVQSLNQEREAALSEQRKLQADLDKIEKELANLLDAIKAGVRTATTQEELERLETRKAEMQEQMTKVDPPAPVDLHPRMHEIYQMNVENLLRTLNDEHTRTEAALILRELITEVRPRRVGREWHVDVSGDIALLFKFASTPDVKSPADLGSTGLSTTVVAGAGFEPATFRL